jgi:hypothetical protein
LNKNNANREKEYEGAEYVYRMSQFVKGAENFELLILAIFSFDLFFISTSINSQY